MFKWQRKKNKKGQKPFYTFEQVNEFTLKVTRYYNDETFTHNFIVGQRYYTYNNLHVEVVCLPPNRKRNGIGFFDPNSGFYLNVREVTTFGKGKITDLSTPNQIDILYWAAQGEEAFRSASEVESISELSEGAVKQVFVNRYERDPRARRACIDHFGTICQICGFNFSKSYGEYGAGYIEVHHIKPLSEIGKQYIIDPIKDLLPVCSNCHSILHTSRAPSIEELRLLFANDTTSDT